jgi:hypothetical protein
MEEIASSEKLLRNDIDKIVFQHPADHHNFQVMSIGFYD